MRLRTSLSLLAAATAVPLLAFGLLAANIVVEQENDSLVNAAKARNRATMSAVDGLVRDAINTLLALTVTPSLEHDDLQAFHAMSRKVLATQPAWNNVLLHDAGGRQLVNASLPWGTDLLSKPVAPQSLSTAASTGRPTVDDLTVAPLLQNRLSIPIRVPVMRDGKVVYVLTAAVRPEAFQGLLVAQGVPAKWVTGLVDNHGHLIARVPPREPGSMASQDYIRHVAEGAPEGWYRGATLEGDDTYTAYLHSDLTGWTIGYALPAASVVGRWNRAGWLVSAGALLSLVAAICIGLWLSRRIATPMSQLAEAATAMGGGAVSTKVESTIDEITVLSTALSRAAVGLAERDQNLRRSEEELRQQASELRRANTNKSQFLALLSHELRNPLAPLRTGLAILSMRPDAKDVAQTQAMMARQVAHMARLIDDLLDVSRIDRGVLELRRERVAIDAIVQSAVETAQPELEAKEQALVVRYAATPLYVDGDAVRLSQILSNLLNNASKFTPRGGHVELATRLDGETVEIVVTDNGIGFADDDRGRMFDMFVQLGASRSQSAAGLGVGLTIVRSLVEMHGGRIEARSAGPGQGASFTIRLPSAVKPHVEQVRQGAPDDTRSFGKRRVLVVDDNVDAADSLAHMLQLHGYDVERKYDGAGALETARAFKPEVAFIDLNMPCMDGLALAKTLRAEPWAAGLRLIAVTGMAQKSDMAATRASGFDAHLIKPAQPEEIVRLAAGAADNIVPFRATDRSSGSA